MYNKQAFENYKGQCGSWGRGKFDGKGPWGGPMWGRGKFGFGRHGGFNRVPVNIEETDNEFILSLYAAGLEKENVKLSVKNDLLTVSYPGSESAEQTEQPRDDKYTYQEFYGGRSFERTFQLNGKVLTEQISATYADGILKVTLPKNPDTNKPAQTITVG